MKHVLWLACAILLAAACSDAQEAAAKPKSSTASAGASSAGASAVDPQKEADIRHLMAVTGAAELGLQIMTNMETSMKPLLEQSLPPGEYRPKLIDLFLQKLQGEATGESLTALLVPVYDRHFSDDEIKGLIGFYETPLGKKAIAALPQVLSESQQAGSDWGRDMGRRCMQEVLDEHPDLAKQLEAAQKAADSLR